MMAIENNWRRVIIAARIESFGEEGKINVSDPDTGMLHKVGFPK